MQDDEAEFQSEALSVSRTFQTIRDEVVLQYGYDRFRPKHGAAANNTQEQFTTQTMMQCDSESDHNQNFNSTVQHHECVCVCVCVIQVWWMKVCRDVLIGSGSGG